MLEDIEETLGTCVKGGLQHGDKEYIESQLEKLKEWFL